MKNVTSLLLMLVFLCVSVSAPGAPPPRCYTCGSSYCADPPYQHCHAQVCVKQVSAAGARLLFLAAYTMFLKAPLCRR